MTQDYFSVFELPTHFDIDLQALEKNYFAAQFRFHPDRLVGKSSAERQQSISQSMLINEAYRALKTPLSRARHLLSLQHIHVGSEVDSVKPSPEILMEMMELREELSGLKALSMLERYAQQNSAQITQILADLSHAFAKPDLQKAAQLTIRLGYLSKLEDEIRIKRKSLAA